MELTAASMGMDNPYFFIGMLNRFNNEFQSKADAAFVPLSWKQLFFLNCIALFEDAPTIKELAELIGTSHQNAKQLLLKLERCGLVSIIQDKEDKRKSRIEYTDKAENVRKDSSVISDKAMQHIFKDIAANELEVAIKVLCQLEANLNKMEL